MQVGDYEFTSQPFIRYLGVIIDVRLKFSQLIYQAKQKNLLWSVVTSMLMYGILIWTDELQAQK